MDKRSFFLKQISKDPIRCLEITEKSQHFFQNVILLELVGKIYTRSLQESSAPADHSYSKDLIYVHAKGHLTRILTV